MTRQQLLSCLAAAEGRLAFTAAANGGHGVKTLRLGETHHCSDEAPDALCADPGDPYLHRNAPVRRAPQALSDRRLGRLAGGAGSGIIAHCLFFFASCQHTHHHRSAIRPLLLPSAAPFAISQSAVLIRRGCS